MTTLEDLRILDLSEAVAGAYCTALFAGYGADVIFLERPSGSALRETPDWERLGGGKRSVTLDIETEDGRKLFRRLVEQANVVVATYTDGTMERLGLSFTELHSIKRRIILVSLPPRRNEDTAFALLTGLNAFSATAIAAHNADAYEVPQHIKVAAEQCIAAASESSVAPPEHPPFYMSEVEWVAAPVPGLGEHTDEFLVEELGLGNDDLEQLRATGVI
jgi:crotonobetainyl-CoA:carnitine CoA-transferase CaiB-like acyl-CoA transferase